MRRAGVSLGFVIAWMSLVGCGAEPQESVEPYELDDTGVAPADDEDAQDEDEDAHAGSDDAAEEHGPCGSTGGAMEESEGGADEGAVAETSGGSSGGEDDAAGSSGGDEIEPPPCPEPQMVHFPVEAPHNIGYDNPSCGTGTCEVSCPDVNANSDWNGPGGHHGIDVFAHHQAPLVAVADATVEAVGVVSDTSGLRVRIRDACGWEYYYGHLDDAMVEPGQVVVAGQQIGTMGATGTQSVHLHFNVSFEGNYNDDIDPFDLLNTTSPTACD